MIRKIVEIRTSDKKIGRPQELAFFMHYNQLVNDTDVLIQSPPDPIEERRDPQQQEVEIKICEED